MHCCVESFECLLVKFRSYFLLNRIRGLIDLPSSSKGNCLAAKKRSKFCFVVCFWGRDLQGCLGIMMADFISALLVHNEQAELWPPETFLISRLGTSRTFEKQHRHTVQASFFGQKVKQKIKKYTFLYLLCFTTIKKPREKWPGAGLIRFTGGLLDVMPNLWTRFW